MWLYRRIETPKWQDWKHECLQKAASIFRALSDQYNDCIISSTSAGTVVVTGYPKIPLFQGILEKAHWASISELAFLMLQDALELMRSFSQHIVMLVTIGLILRVGCLL